jgi:hypothetical protein
MAPKPVKLAEPAKVLEPPPPPVEVPKAPIPPDERRLRHQLGEISRLLAERSSAIEPAELRRLQTRWFNLASAVKPGLSDERRLALSEQITALSREVITK